MPVIILFITLLLLPLTALAATATNGMTVPDAHPRLFWTDARKTQAQAWAATNGYTALTTNTRPLDLYDNLFGCYVLGSSAACTTAVNAATSFSTTCSSSSGCDDLRTTGESVLLAYDWLYPQLTSGQRSTMITNWNTWMTNQNGVSWGGPTMPTNNYFAGKTRNNFTLGVATLGDNGSATGYLDYGMSTLWPALTTFSAPGGSGYGLHNQEGGGEYGRYGLDYYTLVLPSAKLLGRNLWQETIAFKAGVLQTIYNTMPMQTTSRGLWDMFTWADDEVWSAGTACSYQSHNGYDGHGGCGAGSQYYGDFMQSAATEFSSTVVGQVARKWLTTVTPAVGPILRSVDGGGSETAFTALPLDYYSSGAQYLYTRNNWTGTATSLLWQMGLNRGGSGHGHRDAGTFQAFRKGAYLIRETPAYSETVAGYKGVGTVSGGTGLAHNVPVIGGLASLTIDGSANCDGPGEVKRLASASGYSFAAVDLTKAYQNAVTDSGHPERANPYAVSVVRELFYLRGVDAMVVADRLKTDSASRSTAFISHCEAVPVVSGNTVTCTVSGQTAKYTALNPAAFTVVAENANSATADNWQYRIEGENANPGNVTSYNVYAVQFCDAGGCGLAPTLTDSNAADPLSGTITVALDGSNSVQLQKGIVSTGGAVTVAGASAALPTGVQEMTITDNGPAWGGTGALLATPATAKLGTGRMTGTLK